jgi:hypothetical protein
MFIQIISELAPAATPSVCHLAVLPILQLHPILLVPMHRVSEKRLPETGRQRQLTLPNLDLHMPLLLPPLPTPAARPHPIQHHHLVPIPGRHLPSNRRQMRVVGIASRVEGPTPGILPDQERLAVQRLVPILMQHSRKHSMPGKHSNTGNPNRSKPVPSMEIRHSK